MINYPPVVILLLSLFLSIPQAIRAQCPCVSTQCGQLNVGFDPGGGVEFCEGQTITFKNTSDIGFDFFIIDWTDGIIDTIRNYDEASHVYRIPDDELCNTSSITFSICFVGVKNCAEGKSCASGTYDFAIKPRPLASFDAPEEICISEPLSLFNQSCNGETYEWDFGDGQTSTEENPSHTFSGGGTYTLRLKTKNSCGENDASRTIRVVEAPDAQFSFMPNAPEDLCNPATVQFDDQSPIGSTRWTITPADTLKWCFTDTAMRLSTDDIEVRFKQPGTYEVTLTARNACPADEQTEIIEILEKPVANLRNIPPSCDQVTLSAGDIINNIGGSISNLTWTFEGGNPATATGSTFGPVTFNRSGRIILNASSPCGNIERTKDVVVASTEAIAMGDNPIALCQNADPVMLQATPAGIWSGQGISEEALSPEGMFDPSRLAPGTYTLLYSAGTDQCPNTAETTITILAGVGVVLEAVEPACKSLELNTQNIVNYNGEVNTYNWSFNGNTNTTEFPTLSFAPGTTELVIAVIGECGSATDTIEVIVQDDTPIMIEPLPAPLCSGSAPDTLAVNVEGGTWSGNGIIDEDLGIFDPAEVTADQTHTVTYAFQDGACANSGTMQIEVVASQTARVTDLTICTDSDPTQLEVDQPNGTWSGEGTSVDGLFDPSGLAADQTYSVDYSFVDPNNCAVTATGSVLVEALPILNKRDTIQLCLSDIDLDIAQELNYAPLPAGGNTTWSGSGISDADGTFNSANLPEGFYTITMQYDRNDCTVMASSVVEIIQARTLQLSPDTVICISAGTLQLESNLTGGNWSGDVSINADGLVDLEATRGRGDIFQFNYAYQTGSSCEQAASVTVEVINLEDQVSAGMDESVCEGTGTFSLSGGFPENGTWSGFGLTSESTGTLNLSNFVLDSAYTYTYTIESEQVVACAAESFKTFIIHSNPTASFEIDGLACINETFDLINNSQNAVRFHWDFGDGMTSNLETPRHTYQTKATYELQLTSISEFGCEDQAAQSLFITSPPTAAFTLDENEGCAPFELRVNNQSFGDDIRQFWRIDGDTIFGSELNDLFLDSITMDSIFTVQLNVVNLCGVRTAEADVLVHPYPLVNFGISQDEGCSPSKVELIDRTLGNPMNYEWQTNGQRYFEPDIPIQVYTTSDTAITVYPIILTVSNECGMGTLTKEVTVFPPNVEAFIEQDTLRGCPPLSIAMESFATPGANISWLITDEAGNEREGNSDAILLDTLFTPGIYRVLLFASNCGTDTDTAYVEVLSTPEVAFAPSRPLVCVGDSITFLNASSGISSSEWDFGDGQRASDRSPTHRFDSAGVYQVQLTGYSLLNECPTVVTKEIIVAGNPTARFEPSVLSGCVPLTVNFTNNSEGFSNLRSVWDFGDGSSNVFDTAPSHQFTRPGNYQVTLQVFDDNHCFADTSIVNVFVYGPPESRFELAQPEFCERHDLIAPINTSVDAVSFEWQIGDTTFRDASPAFKPDTPGEYTITLVVENRFQCKDTMTQTFTVRPSPLAAFSVDNLSGCQELSVNFTNSSQKADNYIWDFGDGNTSNDSDPAHLYTTDGKFRVTLIANTLNDCPSDSSQLEIEVYPKPTAQFTIEKEDKCGTPNQVVFNNESSNGQDYNWNFGDNNQSDIINPVHSYSEPGIYSIGLSVMNQFGCSDFAIDSVDIFGQPIADFDISAIEGCEDLDVVLTNFSSQSLRYIWRIESQPESSSVSPSFTLTAPGSYDIQLVAIYNEACRDSVFINDAITVYQSPVADFSFTADEDPNVIGEVQFNNRSSLADRFFWDFGDGNTSTEADPYHVYDINRSIPVHLIAYNDNNGQFVCPDTATQRVDPEWITTYFAPNAFAPDYGEGKVRVFQPAGIGIDEYEISVFSKWGNLVWQSTELENNRPTGFWNGQLFNTGKGLPQGTYSWIARIKFVNGVARTEKGTVTILR